ncbi:transporter substrate-binding domain-containing protein [Ottowia sp. SB7-C50]|uniref:transporter substrate-binding domain-containing protein n=1 Tax=Ottowia sp. SB7-C50 TaxID=3081231 RepID=UPI0029540DFF|nr:transporter substrate-binding domain-containing protein [Ottowia sp. SB7-C50]WOP15161.1 transporter substrate-binding domain-containing protein [Ottowia sp. SB7-C50]
MRSISTALTLAAALSLTACATAPSAQRPSTAGASALDTVLQRGVLKACMPGDYKPFGFLKADGAYEGIDVDLTQSLAKAIGPNVKVEYVKTTWAKLMDDFTGGACDIGVGGISVTTDRQKRAFFSAPYMVNGKTPIVRCADVGKFQTLAAIDQPTTRAIANPGGSNERFAKSSYKQARLTIHTENLTIFDEILAGRQDVFVTEAAEAMVQQRQKPGLCAVNPDKPLQYGEIAFLLPRGDTVFKAFVDQWLHLSKATGEYAAIESRWLR